MSTTTTNYGFVKPAGTERIAVSVLNSNADAIDTAVADKVSKGELVVNLDDAQYAVPVWPNNATVAIQAVIDSVSAAGGGTILCTRSLYRLAAATAGGTGTVIVKAGVTLQGLGRGKTVFKIPDGDIATTAWDMISVRAAGVTIRDLTVDGNRTNQTWPIVGSANYGINVSSGSDVLVENCEAKNITDNGMGAPANASQVIFRNCWTHGNGKKGFYCGAVSHILIDGCYAYDNLIDSGIGIPQGLYESVISNNTCWNNGTAGIYYGDSLGTSASRGQRCTITGNICTDNENAGIYLNSKSATHADMMQDSTVSGNVCLRNGSHGIHLNSTTGLAVTGNVCASNFVNGIYCMSVWHSTISDNVVSNNCTGGTTWKGTVIAQPAAGNSSGIRLNNGAQGDSSRTFNNSLRIAGNVINDTQDTATQVYGIIVGSLDTNHYVVGNILSAATYGIRNYAGATGGNMIRGNIIGAPSSDKNSTSSLTYDRSDAGETAAVAAIRAALAAQGVVNDNTTA